ncbi:MAG: choice-of-anchor D domain-containing protein [Candidatus Kapabacteria bacterium]|nr:choice-of-anchor D domain-containing protein [Candidatus Kapabacteria bacterium]
MKKLLIILLLSFAHSLYGQSISIFDIDTTNFPTMKAKFFVFDIDGNQVRPSASELTITENGINRKITNVSCPKPPPLKTVSVAMSIDVSGSMILNNEGPIFMPLKLSKTTVKNVCKFIKSQNSEFALQICNTNAFIINDFTTDTAKILNPLKYIYEFGGNDFNEQLLNEKTGLFNIVKNGKNKKIAILLTDGSWYNLNNNELQQCLDTCKKYNIEFYPIIFSDKSNDYSFIKSSLKELSIKTGGLYFDGVKSIEQIEDIVIYISNKVQGALSCEVDWESGVTCNNGNTFVELSNINIKNTAIYNKYQKNNGILTLEPNSLSFGEISNPIIKDTIIRMYAENSDILVTNIKLRNSSNVFSILNQNFPILIPKNTYKELSIRCQPIDSNLNYELFEFETDLCTKYLSVNCGYRGFRINKKTLKLTKPNGGETFVSGSDTLITWEGISPKDTCILEYSNDNGKNWNILTSQATNLKYNWKKIPLPESKSCLVKIKQFIQDTNDSLKLIHHDYVGYISSFEISHDGTKLLYAADREIIIWDLVNNKLINTLKGHSDIITCLLISPDGSKIVSGSYDSYIKIWDIETGSLVNTLKGHNGWITCLKFNKTGTKLISGSWDKTVKIWEFDNNILYNIKTFIGHLECINSLDISPDEKILVSGSGDHTVKIWDIENSLLIKTLTKHNTVLSNIKFDNTGKYFVSAGWDNEFYLWNSIDFSLINTFKINSALNYITFDFDNSKIISGDIKGEILIFDIKGKLLNKLSGSKVLITSLFVSNNKKSLISIDGSGIVNIWDINSGSLLNTYNFNIMPPLNSSIAFSKNQEKIIACGYENVWIWNFNDANLQEDQSDTVFSIVAPSPVSQDIDMKQCLVGISKDSLISSFVMNKGNYPFRVDSIYFTGTDASAFSQVSGFPMFIVDSNSSKTVELRFQPKRVGLHQAKINIITQTDTLVQNIIGEGVQPSFQVLNDFIDFGKVLINNKKDSLKAITIINTGKFNLTINNAYYLGPNDIDFSTISGGGNLILKAGDTAKLDLKFKPSDVGRTSGRLMFDFDAQGSPAMIQLFGEGIDKGAEIQSVSTISLRNIICENSVLDSVQIKNIGNGILTIDSIKIIGKDNSNFTIQKNLPFDIDSISFAYLPILFNSNSFGIKSAILEIYSNSLNNKVLKININSKKDSINISSLVQNINLGYLCPNEAKDTSISLINFGNLTTRFGIKLSNEFSTLETKTNLNQNENYKYSIKFLGLPNEGNFNGTLTIIDSICNKSQNINYTGTIDIPKVVIDKLEINTTQGNAQSGDILVHNNGNRDIILNNISGLNSPFSLDNNAFPIKIPANSKTKISFNYLSSNTLKDSINITFNFNTCNLILKSDIIGITKFPNITLKVGSIEAKVGDDVEVPIYILNGSNLTNAGVTIINADFTVNKTLLYSLDNFSKTYIDDSLKLSLSNVSFQTNNTNEIARLKFKTALGNSDFSSLKLSNVQTIGNNIDITLIDGKLTLTDVCYDGGARFLNGTIQTNLFTVFPNPANDNIEIEYSNADNGLAEFKLINVLGEVVSIIPLEKTQNGKAKMNLKNLPSGQYFGLFNTESINQNMIISVIR